MDDAAPQVSRLLRLCRWKRGSDGAMRRVRLLWQSLVSNPINVPIRPATSTNGDGGDNSLL